MILYGALTLDKMAKYRVLFICLFGLLCFKTLTLGQQYAPDPSLEEIKNMDAQEGLPRGECFFI